MFLNSLIITHKGLTRTDSNAKAVIYNEAINQRPILHIKRVQVSACVFMRCIICYRYYVCVCFVDSGIFPEHGNDICKTPHGHAHALAYWPADRAGIYVFINQFLYRVEQQGVRGNSGMDGNRSMDLACPLENYTFEQKHGMLIERRPI